MTDLTSEKLRIRDLENADKLSTKRLVLEYGHLLQVLRAEHQYALLSAEQLDELKGVPIDDGVLSFFGDYHVLCNLLDIGNYHWLYEIFDIDRLTFLSIRSAGLRRWKELMALRYQMEEQLDSFLEYFRVCYVRAEYPVLDADRDYSLAEKFETGFDQMLAHLKRVAEYKPALRKDLDYLQWFFVDKLELAGVATKVKITTERARQIRVYLLGQLRHGYFKMADHVRLSSDLMLDLQFVENSSPRYKTAPLLKAALGCEHYDDTVLAGVLSLKKTHNEGEKTYSFVNFDQPYYVPESEFLGTVKTYMACLYKVFVGEGAEVRPMTLDQIMDNLSALDPETEFSMDIVQGILDQHLWLEKSEADGGRRYQMEYVRLHDYQKFARIIYEQKRVSVEEAERIDREKSTDGEYITSITNIWSTTSGHYSWVCTGGQSGVYVYNESGKAVPQLMEVIKAYTKERKMCRLEEVMDYLRGLNYYKVLKEVTVRAYILLSCQPSNDDGNLFCHSDYLADYPNYSWRSRTRAGVVNWIIRHTLTALKETADGQLKFSVIHKLLKEEAEKSEEKYDVKNYMYYLGQYTGADSIFEKSEDEKMLLLTEK